jgi:hypothetical protein
MSERTDWLKEYERYLDGEIEYQDLPPRPAPSSAALVTADDDSDTMVISAYKVSLRSALKMSALASAWNAAVTVTAFVVGAPWWAVMVAQWAATASFIKGTIWYLDRNEARSPKRRDPTLDESSKGRE